LGLAGETVARLRRNDRYSGAKAISHETTFERDIDDSEVLRAWLLDLTEQVGWRLRRHGLRARIVHLKVRFADFSTITRSQTLPEPTDVTQELWKTAAEVFSDASA
jgi:DNA polymerase-4